MDKNNHLPEAAEIVLQPPLSTFFHASSIAYDGLLLEDCFAPDAVLQDEGMEFHGPEAISGHILKANRDAGVSMEITNLTERDGETIVTALLTGQFEGSPLPLDFHFTLEGEKIKTLNITLTENEQ